MLGGTERFMLLWKRHLEDSGYNVAMWPIFPLITYDLCIHSNVFNPRVKARKHILWGGSWHLQGREHVDKVILNSQHMQDILGWKEAVVIPAPYDADILKYKDSMRCPRRIVSTANPNRYISHAIEIAKLLVEQNVIFEWIITGGNRLYAESFGECYDFHTAHEHIHYTGAVNRHELLNKLTSASVWVYPNFSDNSETLCVAALEACALGIPTVVPARGPFSYTLPYSVCESSPGAFSERIIRALDGFPEKQDDVSQFDSRVVFPQLLEEVKSLIGE